MSGVIEYLKCLFGFHSCRDVHKLLFDYAQGTLDPELKKRMDEHLKDCPPCLKYVQSYRETIKATHRCCAREVEIPAELRAKLEDFIKKNCS